ncbi:MAG TPA: alpha/beta hydrolase [Kofleriaceae bacterium]|nr:alpha/beta hydrolase [Kofleriaceae bacterium]
MGDPRFVTANGLRFAYLERGSGPLVVLLHGFPDTAHTWDRAMAALADAGFRAVAPFMRGYHPTEIPADGPFDSATLGRDALAIIRELGAGEPAVLVGHDWGASAGYSAAALGPDQLRLLVTLAIPNPGGLKPRPKLIWALRHFFRLRRRGAAAKIRAENYAYIDELWRRWSPAWRDLPASETAPVKAAFAHPGCLEAACGYYRAQSLRGSDPSQRKPIAVPTVSFAGLHDMIEPRLYEKVRHCYTGSYEVVQVPGGHFMHREHPDTFAAELVRVVREHVRSDPTSPPK